MEIEPEKIVVPIDVPRAELRSIFQARTFTDARGNMLPYRLFTPRNYSSHAPAPLTVFLHGSGESGVNNESQLGLSW